MIENAFFTLVCLGLETRKSSEVDAKAVFNCLTMEDWLRLKHLSEIQGVSAIVFDGLNSLVQSNNGYISINIEGGWWKQFVLEWAGSMLKIEELNKRQNSVMDDLASHWKDKGCLVMVFKGQANSVMYPKPSHRTPGDIDCYLFGDYAKGNEVARSLGAQVNDGWYKHSVINYRDEVFENHQFFVCTRGGKNYKLLEKELEYSIGGCEGLEKLTPNVLRPSDQWTAMFLAYHACGHFLSEGLRMKQLLDWALFLKNKQDRIDWVKFYEFCERYSLRIFIDAITTICVNQLGVLVTENNIMCSSPYEHKIIHSMLYDEDYVFSSGKNAWYNRWHLINNLFRYRWKYEEIYEDRVWSRLCRYAKGFLFHTE